MFGFEFADKQKHHIFPRYDIEKAVKPEAISSIAPLVWQEHCIECAMPACYGTCTHYKRRSDGRCKLFKYGIERFENKDAVLGQNIVIDMNEWGKLETFFFTSGMAYEELKRINKRIVRLGNAAQILKAGKMRRLSYYIKEYYTRKIGDTNKNIPHFFLCEIVEEDEPYILNLENRAGDKIVYRTNLKVKKGFNRFIIPVSELNFVDSIRNNLLIYPDGNGPQLINIVSLELVSLKPEYLDRYLPESEKKVKCVVWDLDNTVWDGILGEDGIDGVKIRPQIVKIIKDLDAKGIVNAIASKNYEDKAVEALKHFGIFDYFVSMMINWEAKSQSIKSIVRILDIGMDTFVFVDDSFFELNEVRENCPGIRVCNVTDIEKYVKGNFFDVPVTEDSRRRRESYKEIAIRNKAAAEHSDDLMEFLKNCQMKVEIAKPDEAEFMRCYELLQRTNQLNISGERLTLEEVKSVIASDDYDCYRIRVNDKFGDYGLVGFAVFDITNDLTVILRHFVFSCRAARKKIEQSFFEYMIEKYEEQGYQTLEFVCKITEKNSLMRDVLEETGLFEKIDETIDHYRLRHTMNQKFEKTDIVTVVNR